MSEELDRFEQELLAAVEHVKELLRADESLSRMDVTICIEGRMDGELKITFKLGEWDAEVKGGNLNAVIAEFLRQRDWSARHAPLCLPNAL